jgi:adenylate cyclase
MQLFVVLLWGLAISLAFRLAPVLAAVLMGIGAAAIYMFIAQTQFNISAIWLPTVVPILWQLPLALFAAVFWRFWDMQHERDHIRRAFGYYLPARVVDQISKSVGALRLDGEVTYGVCLSTDAEQYATLAEKMHPRELGALMNDYYATVFRPVKSHGGIVSDVIGDAMLAIWAGARPGSELRRRACSAAFEIQHDVEAFNSARDQKLPTRIGLHTGEILLGNVGAMDRYEYRAVGDIVNTATRIQELNKHLKTRILASAESLMEIDGFVSRELGIFLLAGKSAPTSIYELLSPLAHENRETQQLTAGFLDALNIFKAKQWRNAEREFARLQGRYPDDGPTRFYLGLCRHYLSHPPALESSGIVSVSKLGVVR